MNAGTTPAPRSQRRERWWTPTTTWSCCVVACRRATASIAQSCSATIAEPRKSRRRAPRAGPSHPPLRPARIISEVRNPGHPRPGQRWSETLVTLSASLRLDSLASALAALRAGHVEGSDAAPPRAPQQERRLVSPFACPAAGGGLASRPPELRSGDPGDSLQDGLQEGLAVPDRDFEVDGFAVLLAQPGARVAQGLGNEVVRDGRR
jgi:hypothetical protein